MKIDRYLTALLIISGLTVVSSQDLTREAYNRYSGSSRYTFKTEGHGELLVERVSGDIVISGEPIDKLEIVEAITVRANSDGRAKAVYEAAKATVAKGADEDEALVVRVTGKRQLTNVVSSQYTIRLPTIFSLVADSRGGDVEVSGVQGEIEISTTGGDLDLADISGRISASTSGGDVEGWDLSGRMFLNTAGGDIEVRDIEGELNANSSGGDISVEIVQGAVSVRTGGGDIELIDIRGREVSARTGGGDIEAQSITGSVDFTSGGGNIELDQVDGEVEASTSGGDIEMEEIRGNVQVWTSAGSIMGHDIQGSLDGRTTAGNIVVLKTWNRMLEDHDVDLKTLAGDIELTLPKDFPAKFSARVITPDDKPYKAIISDFPLSITASETVARAQGSSGDGTFDVKLESSFGTITILWED